MEMGHMGERITEMLEAIMPAIISGDRQSLKQVAKIDDEVDILHGHIISYLGDISKKALTEEQTRKLIGLMGAVNDLENIGDTIETDLVYLGNQRIDKGVTISSSTRDVLHKLHEVVTKATLKGIDAARDNDQLAAQDVIGMKSDINRLMDSAATHEAMRLVANEPHRLEAYSIEVDVIEKLKRIYYFAKRIAKAVMPGEALKDAV